MPFAISERFAEASKNATLIRLPGAGHYELIDPRSAQWNAVKTAMLDWKH